MNTEIQKNNKRRLKIIKWIAIFISLILAIICGYLYDNIPIIVSAIIAIISIIIAGSIVSLAKRGESVIIFIRETRDEIHKVVWPTYRETLHATLIVIVVTTVMSLVLWGLDSILVRLVSFIIT